MTTTTKAQDIAEIDRQIRESTDEANALADMKRARRPFDRPQVEPKQGWEFPRAGVRLRADGRAQLRIWIDPTLADPIQGGACENYVEACALGGMIVHHARAAAGGK